MENLSLTYDEKEVIKDALLDRFSKLITRYNEGVEQSEKMTDQIKARKTRSLAVTWLKEAERVQRVLWVVEGKKS